MFLWRACVCLTTRYYTTSHLHAGFSSSLGFSRFFRSYFVLPNFWSLGNLIKQLFHSRLLDMRLVGYSRVGYRRYRRYAPHWLFTILYPTRAHGIIVNYSRGGHIGHRQYISYLQPRVEMFGNEFRCAKTKVLNPSGLNMAAVWLNCKNSLKFFKLKLHSNLWPCDYPALALPSELSSLLGTSWLLATEVL